MLAVGVAGRPTVAGQITAAVRLIAILHSAVDMVFMVACFGDQEFESAVLEIAGIAHASVAELRNELYTPIRALWGIERLKAAMATADQYRRSKIEFYGEYKAAITALDKALRSYLAVDRKLRELLDRQPPEMRLEQIDAKLELSRAVSEMEGRAAEWCKQNRDRNSFEMDRQRQVHLTIKAAAEQETAQLESERRCVLLSPGTEANAWGMAMLSLRGYAPAEEDFIRNYMPEYGNSVERIQLMEKAEALRFLSFAPIEQIRREVEERLKALGRPNTKGLQGLYPKFSGRGGPKKRGRTKGARTHMYDVREMVVHSLLGAAHRAGGTLTYNKHYKSGTLWPALKRLSRCMPSGIVPKQAAEPSWLRDAHTSWPGRKK
jgi:hypothetical protein